MTDRNDDTPVTGEGQEPELIKEPLDYEFIVRQQRNYKA